MTMTPQATGRPGQPGWPELVVGLLVTIVATLLSAIWVAQLPDDQAVLRGIANFVVSGVGPGCGFLAGVALRIRRLEPFGFRPVAWPWLVLAVALAVVVTIFAILTYEWYPPLFGNDSPQGDYMAAAMSGQRALVATLIAGAIVTPLGEELFFRGVVANVLGRYAGWIGIVASACLFGIAHGLNIVLPTALFTGLIAGFLFYRTGSIWPPLAMHMAINAIGILRFSTP